MKLCINCSYCEDEGNISRCLKNHWTTTDNNKVKLYNPMVFDCFDYSSRVKGSGFRDDYILSLFGSI